LLHTLKPEDTLIHLGDICIGDDFKWHSMFIMPLPCIKILVRGNHDRKTDSWYRDHGWTVVCERMYMVLHNKLVAFTHKPLQGEGFDINVHGHLHLGAHRSGEHELDERHMLISSELDKYQPVSLEHVLGNLPKFRAINRQQGTYNDRV
jgi:calcineurin-like phosphoesterase family protein